MQPDRRTSARIACLLGIGLSLLLAGSAVSAQGAVPIGGAGKRGPSVVFGASCKYGSAPFPGYLRVATRPPKVQGARSRIGAEWVRYRAWLVDPAGRDVQVSAWSGWLQARDGVWATWTGETVFTANWRGNYRIELRVEWWNKTQRIGWQAHRVTDYLYFDEWNTGWGGPFTSCMRQPV